MFELRLSGKIGGDCTGPYDVDLDREYTVEEFINAVITNRKDEWGAIRLYRYKSTSRFDAMLVCEYKHGKVTVYNLTDHIANQKVTFANAHGGWTAMDYWLKINGEF